MFGFLAKLSRQFGQHSTNLEGHGITWDDKMMVLAWLLSLVEYIRAPIPPTRSDTINKPNDLIDIRKPTWH